MRRYKILVAVLALGCLALGTWVVQLRRSLDRAEYYAESGFESVRRICEGALSTLGSGPATISPDLRTHVRACYGTPSAREAQQLGDELYANDVPSVMRRLETMLSERRLPHLSVAPRDSLLPKQYVDGDEPLTE